MTTFIKKALSLILKPIAKDDLKNEKYWGIGLGEGCDVQNVTCLIADLKYELNITIDCPYNDTDITEEEEDNSQIIIRYDGDDLVIVCQVIMNDEPIETKKKTTIDEVKSILGVMEDYGYPFYDVGYDKTYA